MPQNQLGLVGAATNPRPTQLPANGGMSTAAFTSAQAIKATKGIIASIKITNMGTTSGAFTLNDCATTGAAAAGNQLISIPYTSTEMLNNVLTVELVCTTGITLSAVPGGGSPSITVSYL